MRHAEKVGDGTRDPELTDIGHQRAERLASLLSDKNIKGIFSTDFIRTRDTAAPLSRLLGIGTQIYDHKNTAALIDALRSLGGNSVVVGHSNSTPTLANSILEETYYEQFDEKQYDQIIEIKVTGAEHEHQIRLF